MFVCVFVLVCLRWSKCVGLLVHVGFASDFIKFEEPSGQMVSTYLGLEIVLLDLVFLWKGYLGP